MRRTREARREQKPTDYLTPDQLSVLRGYVAELARKRKSRRAETNYIALEVLVLAGLRAGELVSTHRHPERYLRLRDLPGAHGKPCIWIEDGKGGVARSVPISVEIIEGQPPPLAEKIRLYVAKWRQGAGPDDPLLSHEHDTHKPMEYYTLRRKLVGLAATCGISLHLHALRHTYATNLIRQENDYHVAQQALGHADINTTINTYQHVLDEDVRRQAEKMR